MRQTDIAIVGGGLAGSTAAAMLGRAGIDAILIDPHETYPEDFRCEKFDDSQVELLRRTGLSDIVLPVTAPVDEIVVGAYGRVLDRRPSGQHGFAYDAVVNAIRRAVPPSVGFAKGKVASVSPSEDRQIVELFGGERISARLVVLASGLNAGPGHRLGLRRKVLSPSHSVSIGFDLGPVGRHKFDFPALTYFPAGPDDRIAYLTLFPIGGGTMRANFFVYRDMRDPWLSAMRDRPRETLVAALPGIERLLGDFEVTSFVKIRPVDLYVSEGHQQAGIVLVGDAFATSCPAAGTGANKVLKDVERLCNVHIPSWLATPRMDATKIAAFYADPEKVACDAACEAKAYYTRAIATDTGLRWRLRRFARLLRQFGLGALRDPRERLAPRWLGGQVAAGGAP